MLSEQQVKETFEKCWIDSTYAMNTHFSAQMEQIEALKKQIQVQNRVIKEMWARMKAV
jgi:hypothetical protein